MLLHPVHPPRMGPRRSPPTPPRLRRHQAHQSPRRTRPPLPQGPRPRSSPPFHLPPRRHRLALPRRPRNPPRRPITAQCRQLPGPFSSQRLHQWSVSIPSSRLLPRPARAPSLLRPTPSPRLRLPHQQILNALSRTLSNRLLSLVLPLRPLMGMITCSSRRRRARSPTSRRQRFPSLCLSRPPTQRDAPPWRSRRS